MHVARRTTGTAAPAARRDLRTLLEAPLWRPWLVAIPFVIAAAAATAASFMVQ
jgi:hypothetical protein